MLVRRRGKNRRQSIFFSSGLPSPVWFFPAVHHPPRRKLNTWRRHQHQGFHHTSCALPLCPFLLKTHACWPASNRSMRQKCTRDTIWPGVAKKASPCFWSAWVCPWGRLRSLCHWHSSWFVPLAEQERRWSVAVLVWGNRSSEQHPGSSWSTDPSWMRWRQLLNITLAGSINKSLKCFPNLVNGTGDETLYIFSTSKNLRERVTEGWCCLDGWEGDLSWNDSKNKHDKKPGGHTLSQKIQQIPFKHLLCMRASVNTDTFKSRIYSLPETASDIILTRYYSKCFSNQSG